MSHYYNETVLVCARLRSYQWWVRKQYSILGTILCCRHCLHCCWYSYREKSDSIGSNVISWYFLPKMVKIVKNLNPFCSNLSKIRKFCGFVGLMPGCLLLCLINVVGCNTQAVVVFLTISSGFMGLSGAALWTILNLSTNQNSL